MNAPTPNSALRADLFHVPRPSRVLVLAPHPDDEAVGCGGFLAALARSGVDISVIWATDGALGADGQQDAALADRRRNESVAAMAILGVKRAIRWGLPDGDVQKTQLPIDALEHELRDNRIELIVCPHAAESHPDHAAVAKAPVLLAPAFDDLTVMSYEIWTPLRPDCVVNITSQMDAKLDAIQAYESQCVRFSLAALASGLGEYRAAWARMRSWRYAECYERCTVRQYREVWDAR